MTSEPSTEELEQAYDLIARAIDRVGTEREVLFLSKLCLALSHYCGSLDNIEQAITMAEKNLDE